MDMAWVPGVGLHDRREVAAGRLISKNISRFAFQEKYIAVYTESELVLVLGGHETSSFE